MSARLWWPLAQADDIVWCHFPHLPGLEPGPNPRPALVLQVRALAPSRFRVLVAYSTSQKVNRLHAGEFNVRKQDGLAFLQSGLETDTKFNLKQSVELDYCAEWFKPPPLRPHGPRPTLGQLHPALGSRAARAYSAYEPLTGAK